MSSAGVIVGTAERQLSSRCVRSLAHSARSGLHSPGLVNRLKFVQGDYVCHGKWVRQWARFYGLVSAR